MIKFKEFVFEAYAQRGALYEKQVQQRLIKAGLAPADQGTAGAGHGADVVMYTKKGKDIGVEVKLDPGVFAGQKNLVYKKGGSAEWKNSDDLTEFYDSINLINDFILPRYKSKIDDRITILNKFITKYKLPKINGFPAAMTNMQYTTLRREFPDYIPEMGTVDTPGLLDAIYANYRAKGVNYIQVGTGAGGFYYLEQDPYNLANYGVPQFAPKTVKIRTRLKWGGSTYKNEEEAAKAGEKINATQTISLNTGLIIGDLEPSPVSIDKDLTFLKRGLGYIR
jgi:hypothetical protein